MALFHLSVTQTKRSAGQSAIASAAYRAGERLYSEYYGEYSDYTRKGGVICSDILLPSHAPPLALLSESRSERPPISSVCISARPQKRRWRTKSSVCSVRKSAKCDFFLNLMKKSLTFRLWLCSMQYPSCAPRHSGLQATEPNIGTHPITGSSIT